MGWYDLHPTFPDQDSLAGLALSFGTLDGSRRWQSTEAFGPLRPSGAFAGALPWATGPVGSVIAFGYFDGSMSRVLVVSTLDGQQRTVVEEPAVVHTAVMDPSGRTLFLLLLSPSTRQPVGIDAVDLSSGERRTLTDGATLVAERAQVTFRLFATDDGRLVILDCRDDRSCSASVVDASSGREASRFETIGGDAVGLLRGRLAILGGCEIPCPVMTYDLASGASRPIGKTCGLGQVVQVRGEPTLVANQPVGDDCFRSENTIQAFGEDGHAASPLIRLSDDEREVVALNATTGAELPDGWALLGPHGLIPDWSESGVGPLLVRLDGRRQVEFPVVPVP